MVEANATRKLLKDTGNSLKNSDKQSKGSFRMVLPLNFIFCVGNMLVKLSSNFIFKKFWFHLKYVYIRHILVLKYLLF